MAAITLVIPDTLLVVYQRFQVENGTGWAESYLVEKLKELEQRFYEADALVEFAKVRPRTTR